MEDLDSVSQGETNNIPYEKFQGFLVASKIDSEVAIVLTLYLARPLTLVQTFSKTFKFFSIKGYLKDTDFICKSKLQITIVVIETNFEN